MLRFGHNAAAMALFGVAPQQGRATALRAARHPHAHGAGLHSTANTAAIAGGAGRWFCGGIGVQMNHAIARNARVGCAGLEARAGTCAGWTLHTSHTVTACHLGCQQNSGVKVLQSQALVRGATVKVPLRSVPSRPLVVSHVRHVNHARQTARRVAIRQPVQPEPRKVNQPIKARQTRAKGEQR